ncbi:11454_t:CDS:2 [Ambispora leptoticha]|uniref:11454_t:CDS:1 n=1 Tax=Ambispora leptoticha TaxID=144679 RepID=A0A9N8YRM6_9GLOM|nr:11454_t:CDS:2 [Ambispora leptoticha]
MQEVEVAPRDVYIHTVNVPQGNTITWQFSTKKKNISFGLFQKTSTTNNISNASLTTTGAPLEPLLSPASPFRPSTPTSLKAGRTVSYYSLASPASRTSFETIDTEEAEDESGSTSFGASFPEASSTSFHSHQSSSGKSSRKKLAPLQILKDPDLKEILPIAHYNSATSTIKGSFQVEEEGTYCLCFDNSFSRNTSKVVTFFVALKGSNDIEETENKPEISGWLLKKKRKKMQGWAKRWFEVHDGVMSYYQHPQAPCRGTIHIEQSAVSSNQTFRSINMDSGTATYQLKALTDVDFDNWMTIIRKYVKQSKERQLIDPDYPKTLTSPRQSVELTKRQSVYKRQTAFEKRQSNYRGDAQSLFRISRADSDDVTKIYESFKSMDQSFRSIKELLEILKHTTEPHLSPNSQTRSPNNNDGKFRLKKFPISLQRATTLPAELSSQQQLTPNPFNMSMEQLYEKIYTSFSALIADKEKALELFKAEAEKWKKLDNAYRIMLAEQENHHKGSSSDSNKVSDEKKKTGFIQDNGIIENSNHAEVEEQIIERAQSLTSLTAPDVFFDAEDIVLSADSLNGDSDADAVEVFDEESEEDVVLIKDIIEEIEIPITTTNEDHALTRTISFRRRKHLPSPICGDDVSLLSILRKNVGKDLATIAMPISLNEPINVLQRLAEELEYSELLDKAAENVSSLNRLMYVSAFAVSGYASTQHRAGRKPFNPLHGETYECVRPDKGFKFISEKVSHYPPIMACHAESANWKFWQDSKIKSKFWGKSMELIPSGTVHVTIPKYNDHFTFTKPSTWMRNMISGTKYLEHTGVLRIQNQTTGEACEITFNQSGFFSNGPQNDIAGKLLSANGKKVGTLTGRWNETVFHEIGPNQLEVLWKANPPIPDYEQYYGFTQFTIELNELTPDIVDFLPITDTRFRPDQRLFEEGKVEEAEREKLRVEQKQRDFRKHLEKIGQEWKPQWFKLVNDEWVYTGGYFEAREKKMFEKKIELW